MKLHQLEGIVPEEIVIILTNAEIASLWVKINICKELILILGGELSNNYPKSKRLQFIKRTNYVLHHIIKGASISEFPTFYSDTNK